MGNIVGVDGQPIIRGPYEGASQRGPRARSWRVSSSGPNRSTLGAKHTLIERTRDGYRNSPMLRSAINKNTTSEVGKGFTLMSTSDDENYRDSLNKLWHQNRDQLDPWGGLNWGAIIHLAVKSRRMSSEVFIHRLRRRVNSGLKVPLQVELLESDFCPVSLNRRLGPNRYIVQGIEFFNKTKVAYYFYRFHPSDGIEAVSDSDLIRVPARDVIHHYMPSRPGQVRGEVETSAALLKDRTLHDYNDAELLRKKERAGITGVMYRDSLGEDDWDFDPITGKPLFPDSEGAEDVERVQAGSMLRLHPGEKAEFFKSDEVSSGYKDYMRWETLFSSAAMDIPHALMTGDWSGLNDRLVRAILNEYRRGIEFEQTNLSGFQVAFGIWRWFIETSISLGLLDAPDYADDPYQYLKLDIRPDAWRYIHPQQDIAARKSAIDSNLSNIESEAAENGHDIEDNMRRNARWKAKWEATCKEEGTTPGSITAIEAAQPSGANNDE